MARFHWICAVSSALLVVYLALPRAHFFSLDAAEIDPVDSFPSPIRHCCLDEGGGICPWDNTCCRIPATSSASASARRTRNRSGCIPSDLGARVATCCHDDYSSNNKSITGCGVGYRCAIRTGNNETGVPQSDPYYFCSADPSQVSDPLVQVLPRYHLCQAATHSDFSTVWGLVLPFGYRVV